MFCSFSVPTFVYVSFGRFGGTFLFRIHATFIYILCPYIQVGKFFEDNFQKHILLSQNKLSRNSYSRKYHHHYSCFAFESLLLFPLQQHIFKANFIILITIKIKTAPKAKTSNRKY